MTLVRALARPLLAGVFVANGFSVLRHPAPHVEDSRAVTDRIAPLLQRVSPRLPTQPQQVLRLNGGVQVAAGLMLATGRAPRLSAALLATSLAPAALGEHAFWNASDPADKARRRAAFLTDAGLLGGLLLATVDTAGQPGMAWRAQRATRDARRAARTARREARLVTRAAKADAVRRAHELVA